MQTYIFEGVVTALTSISHTGETHGINAMLRREKIAGVDGSVVEIPIISGNSVRGILRDRGMLHMLRSLGYRTEKETDIPGLSLPAFDFLFSGGQLTSVPGRGLDIDKARRWAEAIPLVAIFGGAMGRQIMQGKLKMGKLIPICRETAHLLPERFVEGFELQSIWELCQEEAYTRRDDEKNEKLRLLIAPETRKLLEAEARKKRTKAGTKDDKAGPTGQKQQMRYLVETLAAGTRLFWDIILDDVTDLEFEAFAVTLAEFGRMPYIGGKSGVGHGKISIRFDKWICVDPRSAPTGQELSTPLGNRYMEHLKARADDIRGLLNELA